MRKITELNKTGDCEFASPFTNSRTVTTPALTACETAGFQFHTPESPQQAMAACIPESPWQVTVACTSVFSWQSEKAACCPEALRQAEKQLPGRPVLQSPSHAQGPFWQHTEGQLQLHTPSQSLLPSLLTCPSQSPCPCPCLNLSPSPCLHLCPCPRLNPYP